MAPPRTYRAEALTLKTAPFGEADLLVTLFSREEGKLRAVAKGARRPTGKLVGHLEPLTFTRLALNRGRNLDVVSQAQTLDNFTPLKSNLTALSKGLYVAELVDGFGSEASPNEPLLRLALDTLAALGRAPEDDLPLLYFQLHLLAVSGLLPELHCCVECRRPLEPGRHRYSAAGGGVFCPDCATAPAVNGAPDGSGYSSGYGTGTDIGTRPLSLRALKVLRLLASRRRPADLPDLTLDEPLALELKAILTATVQYWLDREIRSNAFLNHLARTSGGGAVSRPE